MFDAEFERRGELREVRPAAPACFLLSEAGERESPTLANSSTKGNLLPAISKPTSSLPRSLKIHSHNCACDLK